MTRSLPSPDPEPQPVALRKYANRRYYDTTRRRHVRLEEIYRLVRKGHRITITDAGTGEDITAKVLAQLILEHDPPKLDVFPVDMLHRLIRSNEDAVKDFVNTYLHRAMSAFLAGHRQFERYLEASGYGGSRGSAATPWFWGLGPTEAGTSGDAGKRDASDAVGSGSDSGFDTAAMRQQLAVLTAQVAALEDRLGQPNGEGAADREASDQASEARA